MKRWLFILLMIEMLKKWKKSNYFHIAVLGFTTILWWLINYLYHPLMIRFLSIEDFGIFESLVSLFNILGVFTAWLIFFFNKKISLLREDKEKIKSLFLSSWVVFASVWIVVYMLYLLWTPFFARFLHIDDVWLLVLVGIVLIFSFLNISLDAMLRGMKLFTQKWYISLIWPLWKLFFWLGLVWLWYGIYGALWWFLLSWILSIVITYLIVFKKFKKIPWTKNIPLFLQDMKQQKWEIVQFVFASIIFSLFMNSDILLAKHFFDATTSGLYSAVSIIAKFIIFVLLSIETVYYSQIMEYKQKNLPLHLIRNPLVLILGAGGIAWIINYFIWVYILEMMQAWLWEWIYIYILLIVYNVLLALVSLISKILVAWKKWYINRILGLFFFALIVWLYSSFWEDVLSFSYYFLAIVLILALCLSIVLWWEMNNIKK